MTNPRADPNAASKSPSIKKGEELDDEALEKVVGGATASPGARAQISGAFRQTAMGAGASALPGSGGGGLGSTSSA